jgi:hypothetical protein
MTAPAPNRALAASLVMVGVGIPALFHLQFGRVPPFAIAVTAFFVLLVAAVEVLPKKTAALAGASEAAKVPRGRFDFLGAVWLVAIPVAPFVGWIVTSAFDVGRANWLQLTAVRAALCVALPLISVLPLVRYVRGKPAAFMTAVLVLGTAFPVVTGLGAAYDVASGPRWRNVQIALVSQHRLRLSDGRLLSFSPSLGLQRGPARLLVLEGLDRVIDVEPPAVMPEPD